MNSLTLPKTSWLYKKTIEVINSKKLHNLDKIALHLSVSILRITIQNLMNNGYSDERIKETIGTIILNGIKNKEFKDYDVKTIKLKMNIFKEEQQIEKELLLSYDEDGNLLTPY